MRLSHRNHRLQRVSVAAEHGDARAGGRKPGGDGPADATAAACDERVPALKTHVRLPLL
jgi:hypothetical protein